MTSCFTMIVIGNKKLNDIMFYYEAFLKMMTSFIFIMFKYYSSIAEMLLCKNSIKGIKLC